MDTKKRVAFIYEGKVQGVGFRYSVKRLAASAEVYGYVKNEPDGSVRMIVEGEDDQINKLIDAVESSHLKQYIRKRHRSTMAATGEFNDFYIKH